jgi:hypothetical protein
MNGFEQVQVHVQKERIVPFLYNVALVALPQRRVVNTFFQLDHVDAVQEGKVRSYFGAELGGAARQRRHVKGCYWLHFV